MSEVEYCPEDRYESENSTLQHLSQHPNEVFRLIVNLNKEDHKIAIEQASKMGVKVVRKLEFLGAIVVKAKYEQAKLINSFDWCQGLWIDHEASVC